MGATQQLLASYGAAPFVGPLDALVLQGAVVKAAYSVRKLREVFAGNCAKLRGNGTGTPEADIPFTSGALDKSAAAALIASGGGTGAFWKTWYEQSGNGVDATQTSSDNQVNYSEAAFATGALGGVAQNNCWLNSIDGSVLSQPFAIWAVVSSNSYAGNMELAFFGNNGIGRNASPTRRVYQNWGTSMNSVATGLGAAKSNLLVVANGASSTIWINGLLKLTANAGTSAPTGAMKIGGGPSLPNASWFSGAASIAEFIVFDSDPSALPGWAAFVSNSKSYFGTL